MEYTDDRARERNQQNVASVCATWPTNRTRLEPERTLSYIEDTAQLVKEQRTYEQTDEDKADINVLYTNSVMLEEGGHYTEALGPPIIKEEKICIENIKIEGVCDKASTAAVALAYSELSAKSKPPLSEHGRQLSERKQTNCDDQGSRLQTANKALSEHIDNCVYLYHQETNGDTIGENKTTVSISIKRNGDEKKHKCGYCERTTKWKHQILQHIKLKHNSYIVLHKCKFCDYTAKVMSTLYKHVQMKHNTNAKVYKCAECHYVTKNINNLHRHFGVRHNNGNKSTWEHVTAGSEVAAKVSTCDLSEEERISIGLVSDNREICENRLDAIKLNTVSSTERKNVDYKCEYCAYTARSKYYLTRHTKSIHDVNAKAHKCTSCDCRGIWTSTMSQHVDAKLNRNVRLYKCATCRYTTKLRNNMHRHVMLRYNHCDKLTLKDSVSASDKSKLAMKAKKSDDAENYEVLLDVKREDEHECEYCEYASKWRLKLIQHVRKKHNINTKLHKSTFCTYTTKIVPGLKTPVRVYHDTNAKVYKCKFCNYTTKIISALKVHVKRKHQSNAKVDKCAFRNCSTKKTSSLCRHVEIKHNFEATGYKCATCKYVTSHKGDLLRHFNEKHYDSNRQKLESSSAVVVNHQDGCVKIENVELHTNELCEYDAMIGKPESEQCTYLTVEDNSIDKDRYNRKYCENTIKKKKQLLQNKSRHDDNAKIHKCTFCKYTTKVTSTLYKHIQMKHDPNDDVYQCARCSYSTDNRSDLQRHFTMKHNKCDTLTLLRLTSKPAEAKPQVNQQKDHQDNCSYACDSLSDKLDGCREEIDNRIVSHPEEIQNNETEDINANSVLKTTCTDTDNDEHKCTVCEYTTRWKRRLYHHIKLKHDVNAKLHECKFCDYTTKLTSYLRAHVRIRHNPNASVYKCVACSYTTKDISNLYRHVKRRHNKNGKPLLDDMSCTPEDDKTPVNGQKNNVKTESSKLYIKISQGRSDKKPEDANKTKRNTLLIAEDSSIDNGRNKCNYCEYTGKSKKQLLQHIKSKHDDNAKIHECKMCEYTTKVKTTLYKHVQMKHNPNAKVYHCARCSYVTKNVSNFHRHFAAWHNKTNKSTPESLESSMMGDIELAGISPNISNHQENVPFHDTVNEDPETCLELNSGLYINAHKNTEETTPNALLTTNIGRDKHTGDLCEYTTKWKRRLYQHVESKHDGNAKLHKCEFCDYTTKITSDLKTHVKLRHNPKADMYKCAMCDYTTKAISHLRGHLKTGEHKCSELKLEPIPSLREDATLLVNDRVDERIVSQTGDTSSNIALTTTCRDNYKCEYCEYTTKWKYRVLEHTKSKHSVDGGVYKCTVCDYTSKWMSSLWKHVKIKHNANAEVHKCTFCDYTTTIVFQLNAHVKAKHNPEIQTYRCTVCDYTTKKMYALKAHVKVKHNPSAEVYRCTSCSYTTKMMSYLNMHVKVKHNPEAKVYKCSFCDYTTKVVSNLSVHVKGKHDPNAEVHKCTSCDYTTKIRSYLNEHVRVKHNPSAKIHECRVCSYTTSNENNFYRHCKTRHSKVQSEEVCVKNGLSKLDEHEDVYECA